MNPMVASSCARGMSQETPRYSETLDGRVQRTDDEVTHSAHRYQRVTSFRSRRGGLTTAQHEVWDRRWHVVGREVSDERIDMNSWFGRDAPLVLEIGCGTGTATVAMAVDEPTVNLLAVDVYQPGLAQLLQGIERENIDNIRLVRGDAVDVLEYMIEPGSLTGVRVFFPDPWPKNRHHKRRLLQPFTFGLIADRLVGGGVLHIATDFAAYSDYIAEVGDAEPRLRRVTPSDAPISCRRPVTKFENKARRAGSAIVELLWGKISI